MWWRNYQSGATGCMRKTGRRLLELVTLKSLRYGAIEVARGASVDQVLPVESVKEAARCAVLPGARAV